MVRRSARTKKTSPFKILPCLRCGRFSVDFLVPYRWEKLELGELTCKRCSTPHFLKARIENGTWWAIYDRDTRRYPSDYYDEQPFVLVKFKKVPLSHTDDAPFPYRGPIIVFKRRRLSCDEVKTVWLQSRRKCHMCGKKWKLTKRGRRDWHVEHVVPNSGGGRDTEMMDNLRVACASCNLRKGRGYTNRSVREALEALFV
jgi:DNA-directed RNA polymerase subunit RPC12/RpoP